jgi:O-antigen ligase/polysaccharide polymerase Wzy-like membrane protein/tetratricopeptide repeat protein
LLVTVLAGRVYVPVRAAVLGVTSLFALAVWCAVALAWSPLPTLGREEVLLVAFYCVVLAFPLLLSRSDVDRWLVLGAVVVAVGMVCVASAVELRTDPTESMFRFGRLIFPVSYVNANAAFFLIGLWPAVALASLRAAPVVVRGVSLAAAGGSLAGWLATQSKGAGFGLAISAVVLFGIARSRLRLLVPLLLAAAVAAAAYSPLTAPFRAQEAGLADAARESGVAWLAVIGVCLVLGLVYGLADRLVEVGPRVRRASGAVVLVAVALGFLGAAIGFLVSVDHPVAYVQDKVDELKGTPSGGEGSSHFETLESERYDVWRVAAREFSRHPVAGIGTRGFYAAYLEHGRSSVETPARAHSVWLDALSETGVIGFVLLVVALGALLVVAARSARGSLAVCAAFAACAYWVAHASIDWIWTLPASGIVFFSLLGVAAAGGARAVVRPRVAAAGAIAVAALVFVVFAPAWLSSRYVERALGSTAAPSQDLDRARRLDPISTTTYVVEAQLAPDAAGRIGPLRRAVEKEPRSAGLRLLLGVAYREAGDVDEARRELAEAHRLAPRDEEIERLLLDVS